MMKRNFLLSIALALMFNYAFAQRSLRQIKMEKDTLYYYFSEIKNRLSPIINEQIFEYRLKYDILKPDLEKLSFYIQEREMRKSCYDYIYNNSIFRRVTCKHEIDSVYRDSINIILIPLKGSNISGTNISLALFYAKMIKLDNAQYQYIMDKALNMARRIYLNPRLNVWNEEMDVLRKSMTQQQLRIFFQNKNANIVTKEIDDGWQRLVETGLSEKLDSAKEYPLAYAYYHERQMVKDLFRNYGTTQKKYLAELDKHMPPMVKMIATLNKKNNLVENRQTTNKNIGKEFIW